MLVVSKGKTRAERNRIAAENRGIRPGTVVVPAQTTAGTNPAKRVDPALASLSEVENKARGRARFVPKSKI